MTKLILDDDLRAKLDLRAATTELCEPDGSAVGYVLSVETYRRLLADAIMAAHPDDRAERAWDEYLRQAGVATHNVWEVVERRLAAREGAA